MSKRLAPEVAGDVQASFPAKKKRRKLETGLDDFTKLILGCCHPIDLFRWRQVSKLWERCTPLIITDLCEPPEGVLICDVLLAKLTNVTRFVFTISIHTTFSFHVSCGFMEAFRLRRNKLITFPVFSH